MLRYYPSSDESEIGTVGEAAKVELEQRLAWLFPEGVPTSASEMAQYLSTITVPVVDADGKEATIRLMVHKKLVPEFQAIFQELKQIGFPVRASDTAGYTWRQMASNENSLSHHSYGSVIDLNWQSNPMIGITEGSYEPYVDPYSVTPEVVQIFKKYGIYWGGDWKTTKDYMHFTYTNH